MVFNYETWYSDLPGSLDGHRMLSEYELAKFM